LQDISTAEEPARSGISAWTTGAIALIASWATAVVFAPLLGVAPLTVMRSKHFSRAISMRRSLGRGVCAIGKSAEMIAITSRFFQIKSIYSKSSYR